MMTKKHFEAIASIISANVCKIYSDSGDTSIACPSLVTALANYLQEQNPNFDRKRFLEACK